MTDPIATPAWLSQALLAPEVTDICLNGSELAFIDRGSGLERLPESRWSEEEMKTWILAQLSRVGKSWDAKHPFVDATLGTGHRVHVAFPPLARQGVLISLRRLPGAQTDLLFPKPEENPRWNRTSRSLSHFRRLVSIAEKGESILVSGATSSGKTTLANDLLGCVPEHERILALEDTPELGPRHPHFVSLVSRLPNSDGCGEVTLRTLLKQALRMRPDRIILGECRGPEVLDLLQALNTGHRGFLATLHANSPRDALKRIELLCLLAAHGAVPLSAIRDLLAGGIQWIAQVQKTPNGREIVELTHLEGREGETLLLRPILLDPSPAGQEPKRIENVSSPVR